MAWQRIHNRTKAPINVRLTNAGITYHFENHVNSYTEFFTAGIGWDLSVVYSEGHNNFDPSKDNFAPIAAIASLAAGVALAAGGVVLTVATGPLGLEGVLFGVKISATALTTLGIMSTTAGAVSAAGSIAVEAAESLLKPANVTGLYGANDHNFYVDGGIYGGIDKDGKVVVSRIDPLAISYINCQSHERTVAKGYSLPE